MKNKENTYSILDIIEIFYNKKIQIVFITFLLFLPLSGIKHYFGSGDAYNGSITIFPSERTDLFNEFNKYSELINDKTLSLLGYNNLQYNNSTIANKDRQSKTKNSYYISPTRLIWEFSDILQKKLLNFNDVSQIRILPDRHKFYENHLSSLRIDFKINSNNKSTTDELKKIIAESISLSKKNIISLADNLSSELEKIIFQENRSLLAKIDNLQELLLTSPEEKNTNRDVKVSDSDNVLLVMDGDYKYKDLGEQFNVLNYCLKERNIELIDKCKELIKKTLTEGRENIFLSLSTLKAEFKSDEFYTVSFLSNNKVKISKLESSTYMYISLFIISLFTSLFFTVIREMLLRKNK